MWVLRIVDEIGGESLVTGIARGFLEDATCCLLSYDVVYGKIEVEEKTTRGGGR